jgi:hypothetical protein
MLLVAGGKDFPHEPRRAPVLQRAAQLGLLTGDDRQDVGLQVAALVEQGADRRDVGREVEMPLSRIQEAAAEVLDRHETKLACGNFIARFFPLAISPVA